MATWVKEQGYRTAFFGKYLNGYNETYIPPGWDEWYAVTGNYLSHTFNENGHWSSYEPESDYDTDVMSDKASDYVTRTAGADPPFFTADRPFLMWIGTKAPHQPATPAPRDENAYPDVSLPHPPSFDERDVSDKPGWVSDNPPLSPEQKRYMEELYRKRLQSMLAVDDMIGDLVEALRDSGELDNTYIVFTSDNGFHLGQHRLGAGKWTPYEEDIRVPLIVRGPGVPEGETLHHMVLNNDLAPTFADLAGAEPPSFVDGRSLVPLLTDDPTPLRDWRQRFVIESVAERSGVPHPPFITESEVAPLLTGDPLPGNWRRTLGRERPIERGVGQALAQGSADEQLPIRRLQDRRTRALRPEERPLRTEQHLRNRSARDHAATRNATRCAQAVLRRGMPRRREREAGKAANREATERRAS